MNSLEKDGLAQTLTHLMPTLKRTSKNMGGGQFHGSCFLIQWVKYLIGEANADVDKRYSDLFTNSVSLGGGNGPKQEVLGPFG